MSRSRSHLPRYGRFVRARAQRARDRVGRLARRCGEGGGADKSGDRPGRLRLGRAGCKEGVSRLDGSTARRHRFGRCIVRRGCRVEPLLGLRCAAPPRAEELVAWFDAGGTSVDRIGECHGVGARRGVVLGDRGRMRFRDPIGGRLGDRRAAMEVRHPLFAARRSRAAGARSSCREGRLGPQRRVRRERVRSKPVVGRRGGLCRIEADGNPDAAHRADARASLDRCGPRDDRLASRHRRRVNSDGIDL